MVYSPILQRFMQQEPNGSAYVDGPNLYVALHDDPVNMLDPSGMAAWKHTSYWDDTWKAKYRDFVSQHAVDYLGRTEDCADLAMTLLIDFASENGLPVTLRMDTGQLIISKSCSWSTKNEFLEFVKRKLGAKALLDQNTGPNKVQSSVRAGDIMISPTHAALVVNILKPGIRSSGQINTDGTYTAGSGVRVWDTGAAEASPNDLKWIYDPSSVEGFRIDYLNHTGSAARQQAEMKYNRSISELLAQGFVFRFWNDIVFSNYKTWDGTTHLLSEY